MGAAPSGYITTYAGSGKPTVLKTMNDSKFKADGEGAVATFFRPCSLVRHQNTLLVADCGSNRLRSIDLKTREFPCASTPAAVALTFVGVLPLNNAGEVKTFAGCGERGAGGGALTAAQFSMPTGICHNPLDGSLLVTEEHSVRRIKGGRRSPTISHPPLSFRPLSPWHHTLHSGTLVLTTCVGVVIVAVGNRCGVISGRRSIERSQRWRRRSGFVFGADRHCVHCRQFERSAGLAGGAGGGGRRTRVRV